MAHPIVHVEIPAQDPAANAKFYQDVFGWNLQHDANFDYWMFSAEGGPGGGWVKPETSAENPMGYQIGAPLIYLGTDDIEGDLERVVAHGGTVVTPKMEIPMTGWFAVFTDAAGNRMALYTPMHPQG